jgi:hypothetical protein
MECERHGASHALFEVSPDSVMNEMKKLTPVRRGEDHDWFRVLHSSAASLFFSYSRRYDTIV